MFGGLNLIHEKLNAIDTKVEVQAKSQEILIGDFKEFKEEVKSHVNEPVACERSKDVSFLLEDKKLQNGRIDKSNLEINRLTATIKEHGLKSSWTRDIITGMVGFLMAACTIAGVIIAYLRLKG